MRYHRIAQKPVLPIVQRELLIASRKRAVFFTRLIAAIVAFLVVLIGVGIQATITGSAGASLFRTLAWFAYWACFFGGALLTADCLAAERRNDTLGLLFLTDLKGHDVVLGKLAASSITGVFCLVATVPMLSIPMLLGGVTAGELGRSVLVLLNTLLLSLSVGMFVSVFSKQARGVAALAVLIMVMIAFLPPALIALNVIRPQGDTFFYLLYPPSALVLSNPRMFTAQGASFHFNVAFTFATSCLLLGIASFWVTRSWHTRPASGVWLKWKAFKRRITEGSPAYRARLRKRLLEINPVLWLLSRDRSLRISLAVFFIVLTAGCYGMNCSRWFHWSHIASPIACFVFLHLVFLALVAFESACYLIERRREGALELILSTEMTTGDILHGHWLAARRLFSGPCIVMLFYAIGWLLAATYYAPPGRSAFTICFPALMLASLLISGYAMVWITMGASFRAKWPSGPAIRGFATVVLFPLLWIGLVIPPVFAMVDSGFVSWVIITAVTITNAIVFANMARSRLHAEFRRLMTEPASARTAP